LCADCETTDQLLCARQASSHEVAKKTKSHRVFILPIIAPEPVESPVEAFAAPPAPVAAATAATATVDINAKAAASIPVLLVESNAARVDIAEIEAALPISKHDAAQKARRRKMFERFVRRSKMGL
jgi:hypothetical protein